MATAQQGDPIPQGRWGRPGRRKGGREQEGITGRIRQHGILSGRRKQGQEFHGCRCQACVWGKTVPWWGRQKRVWNRRPVGGNPGRHQANQHRGRQGPGGDPQTRQQGRQTKGEKDGQGRGYHTDIQTERRTDGWIGGWMDQRVDKQTDRRTDRQVDR